jgi:ADP-ribose pyrophosphatase
VVIAPLDDRGRLLLVIQYRLAGGGALLELPAGTLDVHDGVIEEPELAAHRELEEETGQRAGRMERLAGYYSAPGFLTEYLTVFLATDLRPAGADRLSPDEDERLRVVAVDWRDAVAAIEAGVIEDSKSVAAILLVARRLEAAAGQP